MPPELLATALGSIRGLAVIFFIGAGAMVLRWVFRMKGVYGNKPHQIRDPWKGVIYGSTIACAVAWLVVREF